MAAAGTALGATAAPLEASTQTPKEKPEAQPETAQQFPKGFL
jgi:hypothetical protein